MTSEVPAPVLLHGTSYLWSTNSPVRSTFVFLIYWAGKLSLFILAILGLANILGVCTTALGVLYTTKYNSSYEASH